MSTPEGIDCPGTCEATFPFGTDVTLEALPDTGATFGGWLGDCTTSPCVVTLDDTRAVGAKFFAGNLRWARSEGGITEDYCRGLAWSQTGELYAGLYHWHPVNTAGTLFTGTSFEQTYPPGPRGFVLGNRNGMLESVAHFQNLFSEMKLAATPAGPIVAATFFGPTDVFIRQLDVRGGSGYDIFVAQLTPNLSGAAWVRSLGSPNYEDHLVALAVDAAGDVVVVGQFETAIDPCNDPELPAQPPCTLSVPTQGYFIVKLSGTTGATLAAVALTNALVEDSGGRAGWRCRGRWLVLKRRAYHGRANRPDNARACPPSNLRRLRAEARQLPRGRAPVHHGGSRRRKLPTRR